MPFMRSLALFDTNLGILNYPEIIFLYKAEVLGS